MIKVAEELTESCTIHLPQGKTTWSIHILGFVADKRHYVNNSKKQKVRHLINTLETSIRTWDELLTFVGNQLEMDKNAWYLIECDFDSTDAPYIREQIHPLNLLDENGNKLPSKQLQSHTPATYLGVTSQVNGSQEAQYHTLLDKVEHSAKTLSTTHMSHYYSHVYNNCSIIPTITYPLVASSLNSKHFYKLHAALYPAVIAS